MLRVWFLFSLGLVILALLGNFWLMWGANPFHLVLFGLVCLGILEIWAIRKARGWRGALPALLLSALAGSVFPVLSWILLSGYLRRLKFGSVPDILRIMTWDDYVVMWSIVFFLVISVAAGGFLSVALGKLWLSRAARRSADEAGLASRDISRVLGVGYASLLTNLALLAVLGLVLVNLPTNREPSPIASWQPGTAEQQAAYREYIRWVGGDTETSKAIDGGVYLTQEWLEMRPAPTPEIAEDLQAPDNETLENLSYGPFSSRPQRLLHGRPVADFRDAARFWQFCQKYRPKSGETAPDYLPGQFLFDSITQASVERTAGAITGNRPGEAALAYIDWGRGLAGALQYNSSPMEVALELESLEQWIALAPQVFPITNTRDQEELLQIIIDLREGVTLAQQQAAEAHLRDLNLLFDRFESGDLSLLTYCRDDPQYWQFVPADWQLVNQFCRSVGLTQLVDRFFMRFLMDRNETAHYLAWTIAVWEYNWMLDRGMTIRRATPQLHNLPARNFAGVLIVELEKSILLNNSISKPDPHLDLWRLHCALPAYASPGAMPVRQPTPEKPAHISCFDYEMTPDRRLIFHDGGTSTHTMEFALPPNPQSAAAPDGATPPR